MLLCQYVSFCSSLRSTGLGLLKGITFSSSPRLRLTNRHVGLSLSPTLIVQTWVRQSLDLLAGNPLGTNTNPLTVVMYLPLSVLVTARAGLQTLGPTLHSLGYHLWPSAG
jgi:hypothetical protein